MQAPIKMGIAEFMNKLRESKERGTCSLCGGALNTVPVYVSVHFREFSFCCGAGQCNVIEVPFCPKCEPHPDFYGCVHTAMPAAPFGKLKVMNCCDFCMGEYPLVKDYKAVSQVIALFGDGSQTIDDGCWGACADCAALIDAGKWSDLLDRAVDGTVARHPFLDRAVTRARLIAALCGVFDLKML
jgi:hypothetical protein